MPPLALPPLPYAEHALEPHISARTMRVHYHKHHAGYVARTNELLEARGIELGGLDEIVRCAWKAGETALFNAAAQAWNHEFFWTSLNPQGGVLGPQLGRLIERDFGTLGALLEQLGASALAQFGSGWAWLIWDDERLRVIRTSNADSPLTRDLTPLLTIDVWEHAYYLDYQNDRRRYVEAVLEHLVDWRAVGARLPPSTGTDD